MELRINKQKLLDILSVWDGFLKRKVHLIACGGTALTLLGIKDSTKDIDLLVPQETEYDYLIGIVKELGYKQVTGPGWARDDGFIFDLFRGSRVHTTQLLDSPLKEGNNITIKELNHIYLGVLNYYDIIISKLFRSTSVDIDDCLMLIAHKKKEIDLGKLTFRFRETAAHDVSEVKVNKNLEHFLKILKNNER
jgi:hypothetical protein